MFYRPIIFALFLMAAVALSVGFASGGQQSSGELSSADVEQKKGVIVALTRLKSGKVKMKIQELQDSSEAKEKPETQTYTLDWRTMVYRLTERNRQLFEEQDKIDQIVDDVNKLHRRLKELPEKESRLLSSYRSSVYVYSSGWVDASESIDPGAAADLSDTLRAYKQEEEERRNHYGPGVKLRVDMTVRLVANANNDTTYAVFVTGKKEAKKDKKPAESPGKQNQAEAARKLKIAKSFSRDADKAVGEERQRLSQAARARLQEVVDKYPGTPAAIEAKKLLDGM